MAALHAILLIDSEDGIAETDNPWEHVAKLDNWSRPSSASDKSLHFMVQCMEAWFVADKEALRDYFGARFNARNLPRRSDTEKIAKVDLHSALKKATRNCGKRRYDKGRHSFDVLERLDPRKVAAASPYAKRLLQTLDNLL